MSGIKVVVVEVMVEMSEARVWYGAPGTKMVARGLNLKVVVMVSEKRGWFVAWDMREMV